MSEPTSPPKHGIRSFVKRQCRLTAGQARALNALLPHYTVTKPIAWDLLYQRQAPLTLEIGFGMGQSLFETAKVYPDVNFLGVEVHGPGVGSLLLQAEQEKLTNLRIIQGDITEWLALFPLESFDTIQIFFPDPWPKARHHKRRLIQLDFVRKLLPLLKSGGHIHLATDWEHYAEQMLEVLSAIPELKNSSKNQGFHPRPASRPLTKYEQRGQRLGHQVWDLLFCKREG